MANEPKARRAGAFDVRMVIALLMGVYGAVLTVMGLGVTTEEEIAKSAGVNINLWAGIGMLLFAASFVLWVRLRPLVVPESTEDTEDTESAESTGDAERDTSRGSE
ncbi:hypothetical protein [Amycolatopsis cihanbeyliensis]|uniref:Uncharacterized protein n=1 Tax=Amycolatopsis cihanbeyliensis TaxID=1128664 RepID=A0A542DRR7_AMYCI|nr:hypothetical protein [Amycolatopsis cihanbeyliensis]TQJ05684.1 hypothetical protein FB471_5521 [Amycolatopsis cihanbeyliensis]